MRVGLLVYGLDRPIAGISRYTLELVRALSSLKEELHLVLLAAGQPRSLITRMGLEVARMPGCRLLPGLMVLGNVLIPSLARRLDLDLVHDPTGVTPLLFGANGARTVVTVHDVFAWSCPGTSSPLDTLIYRYWLPRVLPKVDSVITDSRASKADIATYLAVPTSNVDVIHLGVGDNFRPVAQARVTVTRTIYCLPDRYILYIGSVEKRKNLKTLLHAYAQLCGMEQVPTLVMVGVRRHRDAGIEETLNELDLVEHVRFPGYVPDADLPAVYSGADLFVFPSLHEGFGLPPLEAMACGTPVVCSNASSLPEVVGDAAIMVDPLDVEALALAMRRVLRNSDLQRDMHEKGLAQTKQFNWARTAAETEKVYRNVVG